MQTKSLISTILLLAGCGGDARNVPPSSSDFVGTWSCPLNGGAALLITIASSGNDELTETFSFNIPSSGTVSCTEVFDISGSTAAINASQTTCTADAAVDVTATPSSETEAVSGDTMTVTGADPGSAPTTFACTRQ
jgi:hypothetical protein